MTLHQERGEKTVHPMAAIWHYLTLKITGIAVDLTWFDSPSNPLVL